MPRLNPFSQMWRTMRHPNENNNTEIHRTKGGCDLFFSDLVRIQNRERAQTEALVLQTERLCALQNAQSNAVLERLGFSTQQDALPSPHSSASTPTRRNPEASGGSQMLTPAPGGWLETRHLITSSSSSGSDDSFTSVDTHTPSELRALSLLRSPLEESPTQILFTPSPPPGPLPQPKRRKSRLPMMKINQGGADKGVAGGYRLQTAKPLVEAIQDRLKHLQQNFATPSPRPPTCTKRAPALVTVAALPILAPPTKNRGPHQPVHKGRKIKVKDQEELQPLPHPTNCLMLCFKLLRTDDCNKKIEGLRYFRALAQHHPGTLNNKVHQVCLAVIEEVKNLRSTVASAAIDTLIFFCVRLRSVLDTEVEWIGRALLLKIAQSSASRFLQEKANLALEAVVRHCHPNRVLTVLLHMGLRHPSIAVRTSTAKHLLHLVVRLGAAKVLMMGQNFTPHFLSAASKMALDASAAVRPLGYAILQELAPHKNFMELWQKSVEDRDRRLLQNILSALKK
ncbi:uncharacterized protein LOC125011175 [Mugil cephalus]|uniref:uncharacterized protein LOC125011175 n=1 Tax=Mugil cephalus TaxID=48193 RepID=UPI001FB7E845|nr:uncharacterized protein LOC125011175 [Mugil cephalus]